MNTVDEMSVAPPMPVAPLQMNRQERVIFTVYLAMIVGIVASGAVMGLVAWLGA